MNGWLRFALGVLATWRLTHLLVHEDGPGDIFVRLREWLGQGFLGRLMDCFFCLSVWIAAPLAFYVSRKPVDLVLAWLALSGAACLLESTVREPVVIEPLPLAEKGEQSDAMLRSETIGTAEYAVE